MAFFTKLHDACIYISIHSIRIMWWVAKQQWVSSFILKLYSLQFQNDEVEVGDDVPYSYGFFHCILSTEAMYFRMLFILSVYSLVLPIYMWKFYSHQYPHRKIHFVCVEKFMFNWAYWVVKKITPPKLLIFRSMFKTHWVH